MLKVRMMIKLIFPENTDRLLQSNILLALLFWPVLAWAQWEPHPSVTEFNEWAGKSNEGREIYDKWISSPPIVSSDSQIKEPAKVAASWDECKETGRAARSWAHGQHMDAFFVFYKGGEPATTAERQSIGIDLIKRAAQSNAEIAGEVQKCMKDFFKVKVLGPSD